MDLAEAEFLAEKQLVTIIPNFSENKLSLISVRATRGACLCAFFLSSHLLYGLL